LLATRETTGKTSGQRTDDKWPLARGLTRGTKKAKVSEPERGGNQKKKKKAKQKYGGWSKDGAKKKN